MSKPSKLEKIQVKVPKEVKEKLEKDFTRHGELSKFMRALIKMYYTGQISRDDIVAVTDLI